MNNIIKIFASAILLFGYSTCQVASTYRIDYVLINSAFYKYHQNPATWHQAKQICEEEGSTLFYPENDREKKTLWEKLLKYKVHNERAYYLHVGLFDENGTGQVRTVDNMPFTRPLDNSDAKEGTQMCMLLQYHDMRIRGHNTCDMEIPFICKIDQKTVRWNKDCNIPSSIKNKNDYEYNRTLKSCYKLHTAPRTWEEAHRVCIAEQSKLAVLNSVEEAEHLKEIVTRVPEEEVGVVCLGFKLENNGWKTLKGEYLRDSGYPLWAYTQPDSGGEEQYGAMAYNARLHDIDKQAQCIFVCELKPATHTAAHSSSLLSV